MRTPRSPFAAVVRRVFCALFFLAAAWPGRAVIVDLNSDGVSDIWALRFSAGALAPLADGDGDGLKNGAEATAGTDPFSAGSTLRIAAVVLDAGGLHLTFPTVLGKGYLVQKTAALAPANWVAANAPVAGVGGALTVTLPAAGATGFFYRVLVQEVDTDGDGVNDWEEITLGFDPTKAHSNGPGAVDDLTAITQALQATNSVSISAITPNASEAGLAPGAFLVTRAGNLNAITVHYTTSGTAVAGSDFVALSGVVTLPLGAKTAAIIVTPKVDALLESPETVNVTLTADAAYTVGAPSTATVLISDDAGATVGSGLMGQFWEENALGSTLGQTVQPAFAGTTTTPVLFAGLNANTYTASGGPLPPSTFGADGYWSSRWTGEVLPAFSQIYTFYLETNFAGRLYVGGQLVVDNWPPLTVLKSSTGSAASGPNQISGTIELQNNVRYPVVVEHYQDGGSGRCYLHWSSANEPKNFVPATRLFPTVPPQITSAKELLLLKGSGVFNYQITASANPTSYGVANLPAGWNFNSGTGVISGSPTVAGVTPIVITATNAQGSGSAILTLTVIDTGGGITRDVWSGSYGNVGLLPLATVPTSSAPVGSLEGPLAPGGGNYGARLRGYLTPPVTGVYQFWLAASDNAELWMADDDEAINLFQRTATTGPTSYRGWSDATAGKSPLLYLKAGFRYYLEVRHADIGADGHVSVGWLKPGQTGAVPGEVVPGYALSPYVVPAAVPGQSTLFAANMTSQGAAVSGGSGFATLQLSADETEAILYRSYTNLTSALVSEHIHDGTLPATSNIIFDIDAATPRQDGSYVWKIVDAPGIGRTAAQLVAELKAGQLYINLHTVFYPTGEIKGFFSLQAASQTFTAPATLTWSDPANASDTSSALNANGAARFLTQSTFGTNSADIAAVQASGFEAWIDDQFTKTATHHRDYVEANKNTTDPNQQTYYTSLGINSWWKNSVTAPDQLRQRMAFALSEILVISSAGLEDQANGVTAYYDTLLDGCFGNFGALLKAVTLTPTMGTYLDMRANDKPNLAAGLHPNENYAREIQQLFSIGLNRMFPDGTLMLNSKGQIIPTYDQDVITGFAHAFTGWNYNQPNAGGFLPTNWYPNYDIVNPMKEVPSHHFTGQKRILDNVVLPGLPTLPSLANQVLNPYASHSTAQIQTPEYQALAAQELTATHDAIFKHPNTAPFVCRQLIQRFVTSTPSRGYVYRVVRAFNGESTVHGVATGVRGDLREVVKAILLDYEARSDTPAAQQGYGKQREPVLRVTATARAFRPPAALAGTFVQDGGVITVDTSPTPHRLVSGSGVLLDFASTGAPATSGSYSLSGSFPPTATALSVRTKDIIRSNYTQSGTTVTVATGNNGGTQHDLTTGDPVYLRFRTGAGKPADGVFPVTVTDGSHFTVAVPTSATVANSTCDVAFLRGTYVQTGNVVTFYCTTVHGLATGGTITASFVDVNGDPTIPTLVAPGTVTVVDATHFTALATDGEERSGDFVAAPATPLLNRSGTAVANLETWQFGFSETELAQTPMRSPTVFNFFVPDYQFPGSLAAAGLYTPEFQLTSDTNVLRQANFLFGGIFSSYNDPNGGGTGGLSSFREGGGAIALDFLPWMGNGPGGVPWTNDANLNALITQLATLLLAGHLDSTGANTYTPTRTILNAQQAIYDYVRSTANIAYSNASPSDTNKRDRIRAIVHLLVTSPDFTIQK